MFKNVHDITKEFERELCRYTGAPYAIAVDNMSNALFMCLMYENVKHKRVFIPCRTYPSVPCEIIMAGGHIVWIPVEGKTLKGMYQLAPFNIWDSALCFTADMYNPGQHICISFTGPYKHLKLGKGGAILTDDFKAFKWFKKFRNSGRDECSYHDDNFTMIGRNCYMHPTVAALGLQLMGQFYNLDGTKKVMPDSELPYPDLSQFEIYTQRTEANVPY